MKSIKPPLFLGKHLTTLGDRINEGVQGLQFLFGLGAPAWYRVTTKEDSDKPLGARYSLLLRLLTNHPELYPRKPAPFKSIYEQFKAVDPTLTPEQLVIMCGVEPNSASRFLRPQANKTKTVDFMLFLMDQELGKAKTQDDKLAALDMFRKNAEEEALARGIDLQIFWKSGGFEKNATSDLVVKANKLKRGG